VAIDLRGRPIAITGASSGIGRATALACAAAGMPVAVLARRAERLAEVCGQIERGGGRAIAVPGSVEDPADNERLVARTVESFGSIYAVFANAGYSVEAACTDMPVEEIRRMFEVNFFGSLDVVRAALAPMRAAGRGHALFCSSSLSKITMARYGCYSATKACQDMFARSMRLELRGTGVFVSSVHPIGTRTELFAAKGGDAGESAGVPNHTPGWLMQPPERVARAVVGCLRRPRGEVWTSGLARAAIGLGVMMPGVADRVLGRMVR
jgi:NAD(P)-dependent dehydrogenase (short-subunit alcohol dehydrogenase family)